MFEMFELTNKEKAYLATIPEVKNLNLIKNICKMIYFEKMIYFYKIKQEGVGKHDYWVNYTGLSSNRPRLIIEKLKNKEVLKENMNVLDIGCGLSEIGIEINRQFKDNVCYHGLDINKNLLCINRLNFANSKNYKFTEFDLTKTASYNSLNQSYDIVTVCGAETQFYKIFTHISKKMKPKYIVCESHVGRKNDLEKIIIECSNYKIKDSFEFKYKSVNGPKDPNWIGYKRKVFILELIIMKYDK